MKHHETLFEEYISANAVTNLHPKMNNIFKLFPKSIHQLKNVIFYGAIGIGKYTQVLKCINIYSQSNLKYEKKISIGLHNLNVIKTYYIKISDIHYEVDMSLLGCNSKLLWNEIYTQIVDIISAKSDKCGIILCKNFGKINSDLLECFYSYIQKNNFSPIQIIFMLITEDISFIPDNIMSSCEIINMARPTKITYNKVLTNKIPSHVKLEDIISIKNMKDDVSTKYNVPHKIICDKIIQSILNKCDMLLFRDYIYDIFIYHLNVNECIWYIINDLIQKKHIKKEKISELMITLFRFFQYYNNNYRPIYHLEYLLYYIISIVHNYDYSDL